MGYNTAILVLNDRLDEIKKDPYFGERLVNGILTLRDGNHDYITGQTQIISTQHADFVQLLAVGRNRGRLITSLYQDFGDVELLKDALKYMKRK